jgi:outer membrane receptor protein involved in Fe transport
VRWSYERTTEFDKKDLWHAYHVPIPLAVVEWRPWTDHEFTLSYGTGYRSGGQVYSGVITFDPERSQNLEFSWRAQWLGGALHTTISAFNGEVHNRYTYYLSSPSGDPILASVRNRGLEFELDADLSDQWRLRAGLGVLDSRFNSFVYRHGDPTSEAPPQTATLGARYGRANGWYAAADVYHAAAARYYDPAGRLPAYDVLSFRIGYQTTQWDAALIAANALDAEYVERIQLSPGNESGYRLGDPRRIELRVKRSW